MAAMLSSTIVLAVGGILGLALAAPEQGIWLFDITKIDELQKGVTKPFYKSLFNNSQILLSVICENNEVVPISIKWMLRHTSCANEYLIVDEDQALQYMKTVHSPHTSGYPYKATKFLEGEILLNCSKDHHEIIPPFRYTAPNVITYDEPVTEKPKDKEKNAADKVSDGKKNADDNKKAAPEQAPQVQGNDKKTGTPARRKRANEQTKAEADGNKASPESKGGNDAKATTDDKKNEVKGGENVPAKEDKTAKDKGSNELVIKKPSTDEQNGRLVQVWEDGYYLLVLRFLLKNPTQVKEVNIHVTVQMRYGNSYLSAVEWPLLIFYGVMGLVYIFFGIFWLVMLACNWRDLLRVQFWIGGVIFLGMLEKAVFFGEYESINNTGQSVQGAIIIAELVSCLKRMLARMLVIIVSLGYGIVKPRLGQTFHKVLFVGVVFFILASIEGCSRALSGRADQSMKLLVASIPLAVTDAIICWWIFSSLLQTTRTLRLRRNVVKLSLYRHFTNTLIFSVIASVAYMIWFMTQHRLKDCITDWKELWIDDAFWHLLFSVILFVIMVLWRPSANNQRYAFSPLLDAADDDMDDEQTLTEAYDGMKMRSTNSLLKNGSPRVKDDYREDDLKWVEDNIPTSLADRVLPALDSDEEIMNTKFEVSKME